MDIRESTGKLDLLKCRRLAKNAQLAKEGSIASDEMVEIAETVVPEMIEELMELRNIQDEANVAEVVSSQLSENSDKLVKALERVKINPKFQHIVFQLPMDKDEDVEIQCTVPTEDWMKVPELTERIEKINSALEKMK